MCLTLFGVTMIRLGMDVTEELQVRILILHQSELESTDFEVMHQKRFTSKFRLANKNVTYRQQNELASMTVIYAQSSRH